MSKINGGGIQYRGCCIRSFAGAFAEVMRVLSNIFSCLATIVTVAVIAFAAAFTLPRLAGIEPFIVQSGSMEPVIHTGSVAFVNTRDKEIQVGDIICFHLQGQSGQVVTHRVVREDNGSFVTKGDANDTEDLVEVSPADVEGKFVFSIPRIGYLIAGAGRKKMIAVAVFWVILLNAMAIILQKIAVSEKGRK